MSIAIPASSFSATGGWSPQLAMHFARADDSIPLTLSIASVNTSATFNKFAWAYSWSPYKYTHTGENLTKYRLAFTGLANGSWIAFGPVPPGTYWITGLEITTLAWTTATDEKAASVAAGAFRGNLVSDDAEATSDYGDDVPLHHLAAAGVDGREITKVRYRLTRSGSGSGDWSGTPKGDPILRKFS